MGAGVTTYASSLTAATIVMPEPRQGFLQTVVGSDCNAEWTLRGATDILIKGAELGTNCKVKAYGNDGGKDNTLSLTIDFGLDLACNIDRTVQMNKNSMNVNSSPVLEFDESFKIITIIMSKCNDAVHVAESFPDTQSIEIITGKGDDVITIGTVGDSFENRIHAPVVVDAGKGGDDRLIIRDDKSPSHKKQQVTPNLIRGIHESELDSVAYDGVENLEMFFEYADALVSSTSKDSSLSINCTRESSIQVVTTQGPIFLDTGEGDDQIEIFGLGGNARVLGGAGKDKLLIDSRSSEGGFNTIDGYEVIWDGGSGDDELETFFVSSGVTNIMISGDNEGSNIVNSHCPPVACTVLSRDTFLANIQDPDDTNAAVERLSIDKDTQSITSLRLFLHKGNNSVFFDDTIATMGEFFARVL